MMRREIEELHRQLNDPRIRPECYLRRNAIEYECVTYVNHMVALWASSDLAGMAVFLRRARAVFPAVEERLDPPYRETLKRYLALCEAYLASPSEADASETKTRVLLTRDRSSLAED